MKTRILLMAFIPFLFGCAAFKQLKPDPEVEATEGTYIELKDDKDLFELDQGKKYFIEFPAIREDNFYLLINVSDKNNITSSLADIFDDSEGPLSRIKNEAAPDASESVYPLNRSVQKFYWVIENVYRDLELQMTYRYLPQWRYKFETQYASFQNILAENRVDRTTYENIGGSVSLRNFNFSKEYSMLKNKSSNLKGLFDQLASIEKLFPASIINSQDEAYRNYLSLKEDINLEITFQENYGSALAMFEKELQTRNNTGAFAKAIPGFLEFYNKKERYPNNVIGEANNIFDARLGELTPYLDEHVKNKNDYKPVDIKIADVNALYAATGATKSAEYSSLATFLETFNKKAVALSTVQEEMNKIKQQLSDSREWPDNSYFSNLTDKINKLKKDLPAAGFSGQGPYSGIKCANLLNTAIHSAQSEAIISAEKYKQANSLVSQLNRYSASKSYRQMIRLINQHNDLDFLASMYKNLDEKSLQQQTARINLALKNQDWQQAEQGLRTLHFDKDFINRASVMAEKRQSVKILEDTLLARVETLTRQNVDAFVSQKYVVVDNVESLYQDPVFKPAWDITFTSGNQNDLAMRKQKLNERLTSLKELEFPKKAIEFLYADFSKNPKDNGVLKARAIVTHGQHYKGPDSKIKNLVSECDPWASKWITKKASFRKIYALPTTTNPGGENTYVCRVNLRIPTDARFPAYELNIKLPKEVANTSGSWYEQLTMNKDVLKPEGRFTITAPNASNDYTALLAPLQVVKDGDSILEIRFKQNSFKVYEVSIMAQDPILRKN